MLQYMHLNKKSQSSFEFIMVTGIVMVFLVLILTLIINRTQEFEQTKTELFTKTIIESIEKEIYLARTLPSGYYREFKLPNQLEDREFNYSIIKGKELIVKTNEQFEYVSFLPQMVYGDIGPGNNKLMKRGNSIGLCYEEKEDFCNSSVYNSTNKKCYCYGIFPSGTNGTIQCKKDDLWENCEFDYQDSYNGIKTQCSDNSQTPNNVTMTIEHVDTKNIVYYESSIVKDDYDLSLFIFDINPKLVINKSGMWQITYTCNSNIDFKTFTNQFYVPYGYYQIIFEGIIESPDTCLKKDVNNYTCVENNTFEMKYRINCMQGDCGNTTIWLDP